MSISMHAASVPVFTQMLGSLSALLRKAESHAEQRKIDADALLQARLFPDMFPLRRQVQIACDFARGVSARLAGVEVPSSPDTEKTFAELQALIDKTRRLYRRFVARPVRQERNPRNRDAAGHPQRKTLQRPGVSTELRPAAILLSRHDCVRAVAAQRPGARQGRLHGQVLRDRRPYR